MCNCPKLLGPAKWKPQPQEAFIAYWTVEAGWNTVLEIRNNIAQRDVAVTPVLRTTAGTEIALPAVTIASQQVVSLDLRQALSTAAPQLLDKPGSFGSAICRFSANDVANVFASTIVQHPGTPISFHFDEADVDTSRDTGTIESIWWLPAESSSDYLVLANVSTKMVSSVLAATDVSGHTYSSSVALPPGHTKRVDLRSLANKAGASNAMGGLRISLTKGAGSVIVSHFVFDETTGLSAIMTTFERDPSEAPSEHTLHAPMLTLTFPDPTLGFPADMKLIPQLLLRNATDAPINASAMLDWHSAATSGRIPIPAAPLRAGEVRVINLSNVANQAPGDAHWGTVTLKYNGRYGDVVPVANSFDASGKYGMQTPFSEGLNRLWKGSMWHVDSMRTSIITTGNGGTEATRAALTLFYDDGKKYYTIEKVLQPGEQIWADVGALIRNQVPDKDGNVIPSDVAMGSYELRDIDHYGVGLLYEGKLVIDKTWGHGYYGCASCCGYRSTALGPNPFVCQFGCGSNDAVTATDCDLWNYDVTSLAFNWASDNTAVATVANAYTTINGDGSANGSSQVSLNGIALRSCPSKLFGQLAGIHVPHHLVVQNDTTTTICTGQSNSADRLIKYAVVDINNVNVGPVPVKETFDTIGTNTCLNGGLRTNVNCVPEDADNTFTDDISVDCNSVGGSCGLTATGQRWLYCAPLGLSYPVGKPGDLVVHNDYVWVGGTLQFLPGTKIGPNGIIP